MSTPLVEIRELSKQFGGSRALSGVTFTIGKGEVHAVCGENGAGKSTLNRILAGQIEPSSGSVDFDGQPLVFGRVREAEKRGIVIVHQETTVIPHLNATENIFLGRELKSGLLLNRKAMQARAAEIMARLGENIDLTMPTLELPLAQRQMVGIARAIAHECRLLILDEPTASLSARETDALFSVIASLRSDGVSVLYVSHRLAEIERICSVVTVLRDGQHVVTAPVEELGRQGIVKAMVGRDLVDGSRVSTATTEPVLEVVGLTRLGEFESVSLDVRKGEVVVLTGLIGAGRTELVRSLVGLTQPDSGQIKLDGVTVNWKSSQSAFQAGMAYVPEDRKEEGLWLPESIEQNLVNPTQLPGWISKEAEAEAANSAVATFGVKCASIDAPVSSLSGGNQQKVLLARWIETRPKLLILDEPTRGVDVGAKEEIYAEIESLAKSGVGILCVSSDLPEVLRLADQVVVMSEGKVAGQLDRSSATEESILELALPQELQKRTEVASQKQVRVEYWLVGLILALFAYTALKNPNFLATKNLADMMVKIAPTLIVGVGLTFVILAREIDISVGSLLGISAATMGLVSSADRAGLPGWIGVVAALGVGGAVGLINGVLVAYARIPSIIVTLGMLTILRGVTEQLLGGNWVEHLPPTLRSLGTSGAIIWVSLLVLGLGWVLLNRTAFGRQVVAIGSDPEASHRIGLSHARLQLSVFALTGVLTAVAAVFSSTQLQVIESGFGSGFEIAAVGAVVVGGTSIRGGRGNVWGTALGALLLGTFGTVLTFLQLGDRAVSFERAFQGLLILASVLLLGRSAGKRGEA